MSPILIDALSVHFNGIIPQPLRTALVRGAAAPAQAFLPDQLTMLQVPCLWEGFPAAIHFVHAKPLHFTQIAASPVEEVGFCEVISFFFQKGLFKEGRLNELKGTAGHGLW